MVKFIKKFLQQNKIVITISILLAYLHFIIYMFYIDNILNIIDKKMALGNILVFSLTALASSLILMIFILTIIIFFYILKLKLKLKTNLIILVPFFILEFILSIMVFIDINTYKLLGVHVYNELILRELQNIDTFIHSTNANWKQLIIPVLFSLFLFFISLLLYKHLLSRDNKIINKIKILSVFTLFLSIFPALIMFILVSPITISFPIFELIEKGGTLSIDIEITYSDNLPIKIEEPKNIIFIVSESTRRDVINNDNTPEIFKFSQRDDVISSKYSYASAHFTLFSIFSMWYSIYGYNIDTFKVKYKQSAILNLLKKYNYKRILLTASSLDYKDHTVKIINQFDHYKSFLKDSTLLKYLENYYSKNLKNSKDPYMLFIFLNDTHYHYRFEDKFKKYTPFYDDKIEIDMTRMNIKNKDSIFNRYKNSIYALDSKFSYILNKIITPKDKDESIIIFTGDHGEQFWEHKVFGHVGSNYYKEVLLVPLLIKIPKINKKKIFLSSHLDIWPTILDNISNITSKQIKLFFQGGTSLLKDEVKDKYFIVSTISGLLAVRDKVILVNKYGKVVIKSQSSKLLNKNIFIPIKYLDHDDKKISKIKKERLNQDIKKFEKEHKKYFKLNK